MDINSVTKQHESNLLLISSNANVLGAHVFAALS